MVVGAILGLILRQSNVSRIEGPSIDQLGVMLGAKVRVKNFSGISIAIIDVYHSIKHRENADSSYK